MINIGSLEYYITPANNWLHRLCSLKLINFDQHSVSKPLPLRKKESVSPTAAAAANAGKAVTLRRRKLKTATPSLPGSKSVLMLCI